jgi:hypothetical protein
MPLTNPSITSPRMGDRSRASRVSPRNITGRTYAQQHAEQAEREAAEHVDLAENRRALRKEIYAEAFEAGAAWAFEQIRNAGVDVDAVLALDDEDDLGDEDVDE